MNRKEKSKMERDMSDERFMVLRALAVETYSILEQRLSNLFAILMGCSRQKAGIVFYKIVKSSVRNTVISRLRRAEFGDEYAKWWSGILKHIRELDRDRNRIVHWHMASNVGETPDYFSLIAPDLYRESSRDREIKESDLEDFIRKGQFIYRSISMFCAHLTSELPAPWPDIFQRAVTYPPAPDHPLALRQHTPESPLSA